jgi:hypothetical protein
MVERWHLAQSSPNLLLSSLNPLNELMPGGYLTWTGGAGRRLVCWPRRRLHKGMEGDFTKLWRLRGEEVRRSRLLCSVREAVPSFLADNDVPSPSSQRILVGSPPARQKVTILGMGPQPLLEL